MSSPPWLADTAANFSKAEHPAHDVRYKIAAEYLDVVQGLWDSWKTMPRSATRKAAFSSILASCIGSIIRANSSRFAARSTSNARDRGQPVIFQAGASEDGRNFAAKRADAIFAPAQTLEDIQEYYRDVKARARGFGRDPSALSVLPGIGPVIGSTEAEAEAKFQELSALVSIEDALRMLGRSFNDHDFTTYDLDAPFPNVGAIGWNSNQSQSLKVINAAREESLTLRQVALRFATPRGNFVGTPEQIADRLQLWFESEGADGFMLFESLPRQLDIFVDHVVPILQARGLVRQEYEGVTLRDNLDLPYPVNRYTAQAERQGRGVNERPFGAPRNVMTASARRAAGQKTQGGAALNGTRPCLIEQV